MIPQLPPCDVALIDGDHNWYTVYHELLQIAALNAQHKRPFPIVFFHDITWPYGRRDMYYNPENIPAEFRHPYHRAGMIPGIHHLIENEGVNADLMNAETENDARNGVCTAVEDFIKESPLHFQFHIIHGLHGLGILFEDTPENSRLFDLYDIQKQAALLTELERINFFIWAKKLSKE